MNHSIQFDREKYVGLLNTKGLSSALTELQNDLRELEHECFETPEGYLPEVYEVMRKLRSLSVELWDLSGRPEGTQLTS